MIHIACIALACTATILYLKHKKIESRNREIVNKYKYRIEAVATDLGVNKQVDTIYDLLEVIDSIVFKPTSTGDEIGTGPIYGND